jgi:hypothetical protein
MPHKEGHLLVDWLKNKKADIEYPFEHGEVNNYTLDGVSIHPVTTKIQASFLTQLTERKTVVCARVRVRVVCVRAVHERVD